MSWTKLSIPRGAANRMPTGALDAPASACPPVGSAVPDPDRLVAIGNPVLLPRWRVLLAGDVQDGASHVPGLLRRLGARRDGLPVLQLRDPHADRPLAAHQGASGDAPDHHAARRSPWRLARGIDLRPHRTRPNPADHHPLVRALHRAVRTGAKLRSAAPGAWPDGAGIRRRMGRGRGPD